MLRFVVRGLLITAATLASIVPAAAQAKVAIIDLQKAILATAEIKKAQADLETKFKPRQDSMQKLEAEIQGIQKDLQSGKLNPQQEAERQNTGARKQRELQRMGEDLQADVDRERNDILARSSQRMSDVVKKMAEEKGVDLVVDVSNTVYFKPALDITVEATAAYDKTHPAK
jgi:outer membrane protein